MIQARKLSRSFGDFTAVAGLDFDVAEGAVCALLGPNGAGKSTTIRMLSGLERPSGGSATVCGVDVVRDPAALKRRIGVLPEDLGLFDDLTVEEHMRLTGRVHGLDKTETRSRADQLLRVLGLEHGRHTFAASCSHGMRKKTALAMALLPNPRALILDEPFEAIDPVTSKAMRELFVAAAARGVTILFTSHVLSVVEEIATQILVMRAGRMVWNGPANEAPRPLEAHYFSLVEGPSAEKLEWLGSRPS